MKKHSKKNKTKRSQLKKLIRAHQQLIVLLVTALVLISILAISSMSFTATEPAGSRRLITFYDQGAQSSVLTRADTVRGALQAAGIEVHVKDSTDPALDSRLDESHVDIIIYRSRPVNVIDGGIRQTVMTVAQSPNAILHEAKLQSLGTKDKTTLETGSAATNGAAVLTVERAELEPVKPVFVPKPNALTKSKGAQVFVDSVGVAHRETYYDLPMNIVIKTCGAGGSYTVRPEDGAKVDQDGYVLVAAGLGAYPRCTIVETSLGLGKVYDTGGFALRHPYGFDLATDWTNYNGQ